MAKIVDPTEYPVIFTIDNRKVEFVQVDSMSAIFAIDTGVPLSSIACRYLGDYLLDHDPFSSSVGQVSDGRKVVYEFCPSTQTPETASILMKSWLSATDVVNNQDNSLFRIRQAASSKGTNHVISTSSLFNTMSGVSSGGVTYYPSLRLNYNVRKFSDSEDGFSSGNMSSGYNTTISIFAEDAGVAIITFYYTYEWYLDGGRSIKAAIEPNDLPSIDGSMTVMLTSTKGGKLKESGSVSSSGTAVFYDVPVSAEAPLFEVLYSGVSTSGITFSCSESTLFNLDGTPNQIGNDGAAYLLTECAPAISSSSSSTSFSSSSSSSSYSSSSSSSSS